MSHLYKLVIKTSLNNRHLGDSNKNKTRGREVFWGPIGAEMLYPGLIYYEKRFKPDETQSARAGFENPPHFCLLIPSSFLLDPIVFVKTPAGWVLDIVPSLVFGKQTF